MTDNVNHPEHYCKGKIEVIDCIDSLIAGRDPDEAYALGNAIKYIARAGNKDPAKYTEDLNKAIWYINHAKMLHASKSNTTLKNFKEEIEKYQWKDFHNVPTETVCDPMTMIRNDKGFIQISPGLWLKHL